MRINNKIFFVYSMYTQIYPDVEYINNIVTFKIIKYEGWRFSVLYE